MPIITSLLVAAAAYQAQKAAASSGKGDGTDEKVDEEGKCLLGTDENDVNMTPQNIIPEFLENKTPIKLLPLEQSLTIFEWPIVTVSFYQCTSNDEMTTAINNIEQRVKSILNVNPWLGGWIVRGKGIGSFDKTPRIWFDSTGAEMAPTIFQILSHGDVPLDKDTPYIEYETILSGNTACVKTNPEIENRKEEPLFRITIIPSSGDSSNSSNHNEFALLVSMSHICGDGFTYYKILKMILGTTQIISLKHQRELLYSQKVMELMGRQEAHYIQHLSSDPAWIKLFRWDSDDTAGEGEDDELHGRVFTVNRHWIGNIKASNMTEGNISDVCMSTLRSPMTPVLLTDDLHGNNPIQSTNDILCSFFWNLVQCDIGLMAVNFRKRLDIVNVDHAGNYANPVPYTKEDYKTAALIRRSLHTCKRAGTLMGGTDRPTVLPRPHPDLTFSVITNWSSFLPRGEKAEDENSAAAAATNDGDDEEKGSTMNWSNSQSIKLIRHLPIIYPKRMISKMPKRMSTLIIFSSGEDMGCALIAPGRVMEEIDICGVVKETIAKF